MLHIKVFNKFDITKQSSKNKLWISAKTGYGIKKLRNCIADTLSMGTLNANNIFITTSRQKKEISSAIHNIIQASTNNKKKLPFEFIIPYLKYAGLNLDKLLGKFINEEILNAIFKKFCIGK